MHNWGRTFAMLLALWLAGANAAQAQNVRIRNAWQTDQEINIETGVPQSTPAAPGWLSAQWVFEEVSGTSNVRIKNVWQGTYLNVETGTLQVSAIQPGWLSAQWKLVGMSEAGTYRIENVWTGAALHVETGKLVAGNAPGNWQSAVWKLSGYAPASSYTAQSANDPVYYSYRDIPFTYNSSARAPDYWQWNKGAGDTLTVYNPLDGGVVLQFRPNRELGAADSCSAGTEPYITYFRDACLSHDWHYDAPFGKAGFPTYPGGQKSIGKDIADFLFNQDMLLLSAGKNIGVVPANTMYGSVLHFAPDFRGGTDKGETILQKGGVVAVSNTGGYVLRLKVSWIDPDGKGRSITLDNTAGTPAATVPLSAGSTNIRIEASSLAGRQIFTKTYPNVGMYAFTVGGTSFLETYSDGLTYPVIDTLRDAFSKGGAIETGIVSTAKTIQYAFTGNPEEYTVQIDNCHSALSGTDTTDKITLYLYDENGSNFIQQSVQGSGSCSTKISITTSTKVSRFALGTNGQNAFYLDEVKFWKGYSAFTGDLISDSGRDEGGGWCLSTDPNDAPDWAANRQGACAALLNFPQ